MNKLKPYIKLVLIFILFYFSKFLQYIPVIVFNININKISTTTAILLSIFSSICLLILLTIIYYKDFKNYFKKLKNNFFNTMDSSFKYYLLGLLIMMVSNIVINSLLKGSGPNNEKIVQNMITASPYLMILNAGILAPIIEEIVFRKTYMDAFKNKWAFLILSSFVFGLMHVISVSDTLIEYLYLIPYAGLGFGLAIMDYKNDNVLPSIFMHMFHNTVLVIFSMMI